MDVHVRAIEAVAEAVRRSRSHEAGPSNYARTRAALEQVSSTTRRHGKEAVKTALAEIQRLKLRPVDPSTLEWNVFRLFETSYSEVKWTKWLAAILSPERGPKLSALVWRSLCDAVVQQEVEPRPVARNRHPATLDTWLEMRDTPLTRGCVDRECRDLEHGCTDIEIEAPGTFVILENKLSAGWHDLDGVPQPVRYRKIGLKRCARTKPRLGLVVLTHRRKLDLGPHLDWVKITYESLARALRINLKKTLGEEATMQGLLELWPALLTIAAIEQDLLSLDIQHQCKLAEESSAEWAWRHIEPLNKVIDHLPDEEG